MYFKSGRFYRAAAIGFIAAALVFQGNDITLYLNSARDVLNGISPYHVPQFVNPISVALLFLPFAWLPDVLVLRLIACISVTLYAFVILRESRRWWIAVILIASPLFLYNVYYANLDWLIFAALLVSPAPAFLLAMLKPQVGLGVAIIAWLALWQKNKSLVFALPAIEAIIFGVSFLLGMNWSDPISHYGNFSPFPFGLIIGLPLFALSIRRRDSVMALAAMPFVSPYIGPQSWIAVLPLIARSLSSLIERVPLPTRHTRRTRSMPQCPRQ